ncbi:hypothetical protein [Burkholderia sp. Bp8998]|uniref:hypothetical protein n=1 Tax=Burkholderia sp. Bp8998 TaxID=2184557 RepID=UPI000F5B727D|nr:hypothetical protein [Burkholderia sp. Bp8998]RQS05443.1 hypothetical protein DIE06_36755 [Burkholderia sp. Bp8998]
MTTLAINDLHMQHDIDRKTMSFIRGAGAPWVFGWIQPYTPPAPAPAFGPVVNLYQTYNTFYANQVQIQNVDVTNSAPGANIAVGVGADGRNRLV